MSLQRPDPDELLARVQAEEAKEKRGKLKIFFGAAAGVGKTYAMLEAARVRQQEGIEVVVGYVEAHHRPETTALLAGLEQLLVKKVPYRHTLLSEFDLEAALKRRPSLILVDELAHTNAPGLRHTKRWQDVLDLLHAGIDVYTTVNVQHLESLNDVVAQITGVVVQETFPDVILEEADEVELIDLTPNALLQRLKEGKIYLPQQAEHARRHFFRPGNLMALRELALRCTADRVDTQMQAYKQNHAIQQSWPAGERLLVCVGPHPMSGRLVRATKRMAAALHAEWVAVYVETAGHWQLGEAVQEQVRQTLRLAEQLGGEVVTLTGNEVSEELLSYARRRNVTKIVIGKPARPRWQEFLFGSILDDLARNSGEIDIYVITGEGEERPRTPLPDLERHSHWEQYLSSSAVVAFCTALAWLMFPYFAPANIIMLYLMGVVFTAVRLGRGPSAWASLLSVAVFDFCFVLPYFSFTVAEVEYLITFAVMLVTGLTISSLTTQVKQQAEAARGREQKTSALYAMSREFTTTSSKTELLQAAVKHVSQVFGGEVVILIPAEPQNFTPYASQEGELLQNIHELGVAQWVYDHKQAAGAGTETLPGAQALYLPLTTAQNVVGVLAILPQNRAIFHTPEQFYLLENFANQIALAVERLQLAEEAQQAHLQVETERLRNTLLSSVSHDLRTPLAAITGSASTLLEQQGSLPAGVQQEMTQTIYEEAQRLNRLLGNLLEMSRLESGRIELNKNWQPIEEVIGIALGRLDSQLSGRAVATHLPPNLPLLLLDEVLIEQLLVNLLENALKYTPAGTAITLAVQNKGSELLISVCDEGVGIPAGDEERIFEKFYRGQRPLGGAGAGLGLAICKTVVLAHQGRIWVENRPGGGACFCFTLPVTEPPLSLTQLTQHHE